MIYIFTDSQEAQNKIYNYHPKSSDHTTIKLIHELMSQFEATPIHIHWIGSHINNPHHDRAHYLASSNKSRPNRINTSPIHWRIEVTELPDPRKHLDHKPQPQNTLPPRSTTTQIAKLISNTYLNQVYASLPRLQPFTSDIIDHCTPTHHSQNIPWHSNHHLVSGLRAPYVWTTDPTKIPTNAIGFANPEKEPLFHQNKWIPTYSSQICLMPMTKSNLLTTTTHIQTNLSTEISRPWSLSFIYPSKLQTPPIIPLVSLHKILSYTTHTNTEYTIWTYCNTLSDALDQPLRRPLQQWARQHAHHKLEYNDLQEENSTTPRRTISTQIATTLTNCNKALSQPHLQYLFPRFPLPKLSVDPTLVLLGYPQTCRLHTTLLTQTQSLLEKQHNHQSRRYTKIKNKLMPNPDPHHRKHTLNS